MKKRFNKSDYDRMFAFLDELKIERDKLPVTKPYSYEYYLVGKFPNLFDESDRNSTKCPWRLINIVKKWRKSRGRNLYW